MYSIGEFAKKIGKSQQTLRNWHKSGILIPAVTSSYGTRSYSEKQLNEYLGSKIKEEEKIMAAYCRVSSLKQKDDLERQVENVKNFCIAKGYTFKLITDIGSGINYNKKGLLELINLITEEKISKIVILYKDRLLRIGFDLINNLCKKFNVEIEIIDNTEKTEEQELVEDLVQIITVFSCRLNGKRANKAKKLIKELISDDSF